MRIEINSTLSTTTFVCYYKKITTTHVVVCKWPLGRYPYFHLLICIAFGMQILHLFDQLDMDHDGTISWEEFSNFLQQKPEYLAVIMAARPSLLQEPEQN